MDKEEFLHLFNININMKLLEKFDLPSDVDSQVEKLAQFIGSFFLPFFKEKVKTKADDDTTVDTHENYRLTKQYKDMGKSLFTVEKRVQSSTWGKTNIMIRSKNKKLPPIYLKITDGYSEPTAGYVLTPPNMPNVFILVDKNSFVTNFKNSINELIDTLKHEIRHYVQFTKHDLNYIGLPKNKVSDRRSDIFGNVDIHGYKTVQPHHMQDIEFKPNVHTYAYNIQSFLNKNFPKKLWFNNFKNLVVGKPVDAKDYSLEGFRNNLDNMRRKQPERWKQFVIELYKEIFK